MIPPAGRPRLFTIPASVDFLPALVRALMTGELVPGFAPRDPVELAPATIYLPTRRACRLAAEAFLRELKAGAAILPRIVPIGDIDEDEFVFADIADGAGILDMPKVIDGLERRSLLAQLILKWASLPGVRTGEDVPLVAQSPAAALALAGDLARLMDDMTTRQVRWDRLDGLVPPSLDEYWQKALDFLKIASTAWPDILSERNAIEPAEHRDRLIAAEAERLAARHGGPVIIAGSTGSMPTTARLIETIARLPHGAAVLPGLDTHLDEDSWRTLAGGENKPPLFNHPQFAMQALLARMQVDRGGVTVLADLPARGRDAIVSEALRPADTTDLWQSRLGPAAAERISAAVANIAMIEAATAEEEALAIAVALREVLETPGKTAALVTPDRALARRVLAALGRWHVEADDSGGDPLTAAAAGTFARLAAEVALGGVAPIPLLALLKHTLARLGHAHGQWQPAIEALELAVLRGSRPRAGSEGLAQALAHAQSEWQKLKNGEPSLIHPSEPQAALTARDFDAAARLVDVVQQALKPLEQLAGARKLPFLQFADAHRETLGALGSGSDGVDCFSGTDGNALAGMFDEVARMPAGAGLAIASGDYGELFDAAAAGRIVRRPGLPGARIRIYGLLEARLTHADRVVLGGLVEGAWPPETRSDPWLSRPMRLDLGLDLPERRIGLAAHDFAQLMGAPEVVLTRAAKLGGAPTIASRFVQRLAAVAGDRWNEATARGEKYLDMARGLDRPDTKPKALKRPEPRPPIAARPGSLSVTEIETWLRDPYSIYARHVLRLRPLDPIDEPPGARDRGIMIHETVADFARAHRDHLPDDIAARLIGIGEKHFAPLKDHPEARAFWWPRFLRIAQWFAGFEAERRANLDRLDVEVSAALAIPAGARSFVLRARADRIEHRRDGRFSLIDYKTGQPPTAPQVKSGLAPQLTLEGAILRQGGFAGIPAGCSIAELIYVGLRGGEPAGIVKDIAWRNSTPDAEADTALRRLTELVTKFEDETQPYLALVSPMFIRRRAGDYDHLARVKEWSLTGGPEEEAE